MKLFKIFFVILTLSSSSYLLAESSVEDYQVANSEVIESNITEIADDELNSEAIEVINEANAVDIDELDTSETEGSADDL